MRAATVVLALLTVAVAQAQSFDTRAGAVSVTRVAGGLEHPWSLAFLPDGRALVTERPGRLRILDDGALSPPLGGVPAVYDSGQGGLFDVAPAHDFAQSGVVYLSYAEPRDGGAGTALARAVLAGDRLRDLRVIFRQNRFSGGGRHFGGRIVVNPDGTLFLTTGDRGDSDRAQDLGDHAGKVLRLAPDGAAPADNPLVGRPGALPEIWSYGHRNPQGAGLDAQGRLWTVEHGARGGDEINRPEPGANHGWPVISYGRHYWGGRIGEGTAKPGMAQPLHVWDPSIAPSGLIVYDGALFPDWRGDVIVGALKFQLLSRVDPGTGAEERILDGAFGRIRDVRQAPDGAIWFLTDEDPGGVYRMTPAP